MMLNVNGKEVHYYFHLSIGLLTVASIILYLVYAIWTGTRIADETYDPYGSDEDDARREVQTNIAFQASVIGLLLLIAFNQIYATIKVLH